MGQFPSHNFMDHIKVENFQRDNPGMAFPSWEALLPKDCTFFRARIAKRVGLPPTVDTLVLVEKLNELALDVAVFESDQNRLDLLKVFQSLNIEPLNHVYLNWYRYDDIDKMAFSDLQLYLMDIWYPASDDIDIFDDTLKWALSLTHYGIVRMVNLGEQRS